MPTAVVADSLTSKIREALVAGYTTTDIVRAFPEANKSTIHTLIWKARKTPGAGLGALYLPQEIRSALATEAKARYGASATGQSLALRILTMVIKDDLFNAILDEPATKEKAA